MHGCRWRGDRRCRPAAGRGAIGDPAALPLPIATSRDKVARAPEIARRARPARGGGDTLNGGLGADLLDGGAGDDALNDGDTTLAGGGAVDTLLGGDGDGSMTSAAGADSLDGGLGDDLATISRAAADVPLSLVFAGAAAVTTLVGADVQVTGVERFALTGGKGGDRLGGGGADTLLGESSDAVPRATTRSRPAAAVTRSSAAAARISPTAAAPMRCGGFGNDTYVVDSLSDDVDENLGNGADEVRSSVSWTLELLLERLVLTGTAFYGRGKYEDNRVEGNAVAAGGRTLIATLAGAPGLDASDVAVIA